MVRGYDVLFQNRMLGVALVIAGLFFITAICAWGAAYFKQMVAKDEAMRRAVRRKNREEKELTK
jgi:hypothetical protein